MALFCVVECMNRILIDSLIDGTAVVPSATYSQFVAGTLLFDSSRPRAHIWSLLRTFSTSRITPQRERPSSRPKPRSCFCYLRLWNFPPGQDVQVTRSSQLSNSRPTDNPSIKIHYGAKGFSNKFM